MSTIHSLRIATGCLVVALVATGSSLCATAADSLDGWWVSDGYGWLLNIHGDEVDAFETTAISCLPSFTAKRHTTAVEGAQAVFSITPDEVFLVKAGGSSERKVVAAKGKASTISIRRVAEPPAACGQKADDSPLHNFDIFWTTFDEQYPFFELRGVDWRAVRDKYRPPVTKDSTAKELFDVLKAMIKPLQDRHTYIISADGKHHFHGKREDTQRVTGKIAQVVKSKYLQGKLKTWCNGRLAYGVLPGMTGYLRITAFDSYASTSGFDNQVEALNDALDEMLADADKLNGLVIDVRVNYGGSDVLGVVVASRLAPHDYLAFAKKARNDPADPSRFTEPQETWVRVSDRPHFYGKVVLLTGSNTVSAGETFTMALMGRRPRVTRVGQNTQGVFSDQLVRHLPNGFSFSLPNEVYLSENGKVFEATGVPPHVKVSVTSKEDLKNGRDPVLEKAIAILQGS